MDDAAHVTNVAVDVSLRRRGIATELMLDLAREARRAGMASLTLEVRESNVSAQSLYRRFGSCLSACGRSITRIVTTRS